MPGDPVSIRLLLQPLAPEVGGWQFSSKDDRDWKTLAQSVAGQKASTGEPKR